MNLNDQSLVTLKYLAIRLAIKFWLFKVSSSYLIMYSLEWDLSPVMDHFDYASWNKFISILSIILQASIVDFYYFQFVLIKDAHVFINQILKTSKIHI